MQLILTGFSGMVLATCLFVILYLIFGIKEKGRKKDWLVLFIIAAFLRIGKSFFYFLLPNISDLGVALGFFGYALLGPITFLHFKYQNGDDTWHILKKEYLHGAFPIIGAVAILSFGADALSFYSMCGASFLLYLSFLLFGFWKKKQKPSAWDSAFLWMSCGVSAVFLIQLFVPTLLLYTIGTAVASLIIGAWFIYILKNPLTLKEKVRPQATKTNTFQIKKVKKALLEEKLYRQADLTLQIFSEKIQVPQYIISAIVKQEFGRSFPKTINHLRIEEVKSKLLDDKYQHQKIEALAYDAGYASPSSFYSAFKRETNMSPKNFQAKYN